MSILLSGNGGEQEIIKAFSQNSAGRTNREPGEELCFWSACVTVALKAVQGSAALTHGDTNQPLRTYEEHSVRKKSLVAL